MPENRKPLPKELEKLLDPVSERAPCGPDLWGDVLGGRVRLQQPIQKPKLGETINWTFMCNEAVTLMSSSRDLRVAVLLCQTLLRTNGLAGFRDGLVLIHGLIETYWDRLYPLPDDGEDLRCGTLSDLSTIDFIKLLREAPLCQSAAGAAYSLADLERADSGKAPADATAKPLATREQIAAVFKASKEKLRETNLLVTTILEEVNAIEALAATKTEGENQPDFEKLKETLEKMSNESKVEEPVGQPGQDAAAQTVNTGGALAGAVARPDGVIRSRADADAALAAVSQYFRQHEPASPVPFLIDRARRLLSLNFIESLRELVPDSVEKFHPLLGTKEDEKR
jgi:type VI secretion system protein ImpA